MLRVEALSKTFEPPTGLLRMLVRTAQSEPVVALERIDFAADAGEIVGVVGPNGAGKSTLIRLCATLLEPTAGEVAVGGYDTVTHSADVRQRIGVMLADERALYWRLTGRENLRFFGVMAGLPTAEAVRRADELLDEFGLAARDRRVFGYSSGMRVRLSVARAMIARPRLLILDEPSRSLDPIASDELLRRLTGVAATGTTIVLSSHRLDEVEAICDRVLVIVDGGQRAWVTAAELASGGGVVASLRALLDVPAGAQGDASDTEDGW